MIEELGHYDPLVNDTDARAILKGERIAYWLSVGAQASENCDVLIKKYGQNGTHVAQQQAALERIKTTPAAGPRAVRSAAQAAGTGTGRRSRAELRREAAAPAEAPAEEPKAE